MKKFFIAVCVAAAALIAGETSLNNIPPMGFVVTGFFLILVASAIQDAVLKHGKFFYFFMLIMFLAIIILLRT